MDEKCVTEISELMCSTGGKIIVMDHGQKRQMGKSNVKNAEPKTVQHASPLVDSEEFKEKFDENQVDVY